MDNQFFTWDDFVEGFGREMRIADEIYQRMVEGGLKAGCLSNFDFTFVSDKQGNLARLRDFILAHYPYTIAGLEETTSGWELTGATDGIPVTADGLTYWALEMALRGYEFDSRFDAYGAPFDPNTQSFPDLSASREKFWFDQAMRQYEAGNLSAALMSWSHVIAINAGNADAYYSRAIVKNELHTWKAALRDYDLALQIAPLFFTALVNRGSLKDDHGDFQGAIEDYTRVIESAPDTDPNKAMAYFNRGNSRLNLTDEAGACEDWYKALKHGADYAQERIDAHCSR
jgi:tetratricopeptide (TPR) repeat protein